MRAGSRQVVEVQAWVGGMVQAWVWGGVLKARRRQGHGGAL